MLIEKYYENMPEYSPKDRKFLDKKGTPLVSANKLLGNYLPKVDFDSIAERVATKQKKTKEEILKMWSDSKDLSVERGDALHNYMEAILEGKFHKELKYGFDQKLVSDFIQSIIKAGYIPVFVEKSFTYNGFLGKPDVVFHNSKSDQFLILDYKTIENFKEQGFNFLLKPFQSFTDGHLDKYMIVQMIYKIIVMNHLGLKESQIRSIIVNFAPGSDTKPAIRTLYDLEASKYYKKLFKIVNTILSK